jgi:hypothetical protein
MVSGCATAWVVAKARKPDQSDISWWVDYAAEDPTVVWERRWGWWDPSTSAITGKIVFKPEAGSPCEKFTVCFGCHAPIKNPCGVSVSYRMLEKAETYGFLVQIENKPDQEIPLTGNPYMWLLLPIGVGIDAGVVFFGGLFCVMGGCAML